MEIKAVAKGSGDIVPLKTDGSENLFVPSYPVFPAAANQADRTTSEISTLTADFNVLLAKLKAAGLMVAE